MKKLLAVTLILLISLCFLLGCSLQTPSDDSPSLYYNLDKGASLSPDENGVYTLRFMQENQLVSLKTADSALLEQLLLLDFTGLQLEGDTITGIIRIADMPYSRVAWNYYVKSIGGNTVKLNSIPSYKGKDLLLELAENLPIYDVIPQSSSLGGLVQLQRGDCVSIIADDQGVPIYGYVINRPAVLREGTAFCQHCEKDVSWYDWISSSSLPSTGGHYILSSDVTVAKTTTLGSGSLCLDTNGKTVTQTSFGSRIFALQGNCTLNIMDSVGDTVFIPASTDRTQSENVGMIIFVNHDEATLNLYGGKLDASDCTSLYGSAVSQRYGTFNMYGGTIIGGIAYGPGATAVSANGTFNMYGGRIVGGKGEGTAYTSPVGGGAIRVLGVTTIYDGIIEGGESVIEGGIIRVCPDVSGCIGKLVLKGGTITGGTAPLCGGIVVPAQAVVIISGNTKITGNENGNLYLKKGAVISIGEEGMGENAEIGITMEEPGQFVTNVPEDMDLSKYFYSDDGSLEITHAGSGSWELE